MATFFPARSVCNFDSGGELRLAERLDKSLNSQYLCWFNVPVGPKALQPDFIILHPTHGLLVLEVKDWKPDTIKKLTVTEAVLETQQGTVRDKNPMEQARKNALAITSLLEKDPLLQQKAGSYVGRLALPYSWGVALPNISRQQFNELNLSSVLNERAVLCRDDIQASSSEFFEDRLLGMFRHSFPCQLSQEQIDRIRYHLYPELRINPESGQFGLFHEEQMPALGIGKIMDLQQEQLARSMGGGHRVIHGVAGSGKTMILIYRARYLASLSSKPVLVLCYNKTLASRLEQFLAQGRTDSKIHVHHFHEWCRMLLNEKNIKVGDKLPFNEFVEKSVARTKQAVEQGELETGRYAAILIDEAHDFQPEWFSVVLPMLESEDANLLVLYDDAQSIYNKKTGLDFSFSSVGIKAQGRTTILRTNYRNTAEILKAAKNISQSTLKVSEPVGEDYAPTLNPDSVGRTGDIPELYRFSCQDTEWNYIAERIAELIAQGKSPNDIGVLVLSTRPVYCELVKKAFNAHQVPFIIADEKNKRNLYEGEASVKVLTMHSSKGLEFEHVFITGLNRFGEYSQLDDEQRARLLYVAMTRAVEDLTLTYHQETPYTRQIQAAIQQAVY